MTTGDDSVRLWTEGSQSISASTFVLLLLLADCAFIFLHVLLNTNVLESSMFSLGRDFGYSEIYQYVKEFWIIVLLLLVLIRTTNFGYGAWVLVFFYVLLDDALQVHETLGRYTALRLELAPYYGLRAEDFGQLIVSGVAAALLLIPVTWAYFRGADAFRRVARHLLYFLLALAFFGVLMDLVHGLVHEWKFEFLFGLLEDGGEMVVISLLAGYVYSLNALGVAANSSLRRSVEQAND